MRKHGRHAVLGLLITAASVAVATPASAVWYKLFLDESVCLGVKGSDPRHETHIVTYKCLPHADQNWEQAPYYGSYMQLWTHLSAAPPDPYAECIALYNNGSINYGNVAITWECSAGTPDQGWERYYLFNDAQGQPCYIFRNKKAHDQGQSRILVASHHNPNIAYDVVILSEYDGDPFDTWCEYPTPY